ncbi:glycerophosphodiester phosphodiesterase [Haladaptatus caseinilyticus]|uniref:glycerophosphodiester phosphodiesterase n=1 Tax=Haladaptatus caseinilyticus TaxID=2993314 RepID=UPI00224A68DA|nr:glycerophosphodiester phosphodiesterase [Haladaptatus caseinilyticus]
MELIAHRGCAEQYPENTVYAVEQASARFSTIEIDVRRCRSGEIVVFHDKILERVTDGSGSIARMEWNQLRELEILNSGERIPLLSEALTAIPSGVHVQIELKQTGIAADVLRQIENIGVNARVTSFLPSALTEVREHDPGMARGYLFGEKVGITAGIQTALALDCDSLHPHSRQCIQTEIVDFAHENEFDVIAWGASDEMTVRELHMAGVDAATADRYMPITQEETNPLVAD